MSDASDESPAGAPEEESRDLKIARLLGEYADLLSSGRTDRAQEFLEQHPEVATELSETGTLGLFGTLLARQQHRGQFGDFELILEIGRGGMGIVYEAFQMSLGRRVALKLLPAGLLSDATAVARFYREAKVAASLHHSHIVPVYTMGVQGGTPYFAMELCAGETLQKIVARLRVGAGTDPVSAGSLLLLSSRTAPRSPVSRRDLDKTNGEARPPRPVLKRRPGRAFCLEVARMFADTAEGLEHAHNIKVIHRDLKPSNLILDVDGRLRILDFSLAWIDGEQRLTLSRDRMGTPLYMSPEQARGDSRLLGPATDVYGLGATLYEILTWQPPFEGRDVQDTLQQIIHREPTPPRRLNRAIPRDLQTIVLTCLRKDPAERYATAKDLAEDLRAVARSEPIKKAPPRPLFKRVTSSAWRLRKAIALCAVLLTGLVVSTVAYRQRQDANYEREVLEAVKCLVRRELRSPLGTLTRPKVESDVLNLDAGRPILGAQPRQGVAVIMVAGCELVDPETRVPPTAAGAEQKADLEEARVHLEEAIRILPGRPEAHFCLARTLSEEGRHQEAAQALQRGGRLIAGPASGAAGSPKDDHPPAGTLLSKAWRDAGDSFARGRWAHAARGFDAALASARGGVTAFSGWELETLVKAGIANLRAQSFEKSRECLANARQIAGDMLEIDLLYLKAHCLDTSVQSVAGPEAVIQESAAKAPGPRREAIAIAVAEAYMDIGDYAKARDWIERVAAGSAKDRLNRRLRRGMAMTRGRWELEVLRESLDVVKQAPMDVATRLCLGNAYLANRKYEEAKDTFERARELASQEPRPLVGIGICLWAQGRHEDAKASFQAALGLDPRHVPALYNLGVVLEALGDEQAAESKYRAALDLDPDHALAHNNVGAILARRNLLREASQEFERAVDLSPLLGLAHYNHGFALQRQWRFREAAAEYREALRLRIIDPVVRKNLGFCLYWLRRAEESYEELKQASDMDPGCAWTQHQLGVALYHLNLSEEAIGPLEKAVELEPLWANAHNTLGLALEEVGRTDEALSRFDRALRIDPTFVHAANDYARVFLEDRRRLPDGDGLRDLMERMEAARHLAGADEAIDRLLDECRRESAPDLPTFGSVEAFLDEPEVLIADGDEWQYCREPLPDASWTRMDPSDGEWASGPSGFGPRGEDGVRTALEVSEGSGALYLRRRFVVPDPSLFERLVVRVSSNVGWIAYVNGTELCRFLAGPPGVRGAVAEEDSSPWMDREFRVETTLLEEGENVLAIEAPIVPEEKVERRICPVLKALPRSFGLDARRRARDRLAALQEAAKGPDLDARLAYFEAGILERMERYAEAADRYRRAHGGGGGRCEPILGLARCLKAMGKVSDAEEVLWDALDVTLARHIPLWREWVRLSFMDLERSAAAVLRQVTDRFQGIDGEPALPNGTVQPVKDGVWVLEELAAERPLRINCGGPDFTDDGERLWGEDRFFQGGFDFYLFELAREHQGFASAQVYETERYFQDPRPVQRGYEIPLPKGRYRVTLHFVEGHWKQSGSRSFDVFLEDWTLQDYKPLRAGFGIPQTWVRELSVVDGALNVDFGRRVENPKISAIEVESLP